MAYPPPDGAPRPTPGYQGPYVTPQQSGYQAPNPPHVGAPPATLTNPPPAPAHPQRGGILGWLRRRLGRR